jgi:NADH:ubiquinone reductase (non-electrogenic)
MNKISNFFQNFKNFKNSFTTSTSPTDRKKVVVLGSGWAGFRFLKDIDQKFFDVKAISPRNHFIFTPLLASTTVGTLEYRSIIEPTRMACPNYLQAECRDILADRNTIICHDNYRNKDFEVPYDYLVIAVGTTPNTFNIKGVKEHCNFLRQIQDARAIRKKIITLFEEASSPMTTKEEKCKLLTFVIVGGGPTSCEFSAELHDFLESDFKKFFPLLTIEEVKIYLIESTDHILGMFDEKLSSYAEKYFKRQNVKILTKTTVKEVTADEIILSNQISIPYGMCVWSTGNAPLEFIKNLKTIPKDSRGRILVDDHLKVKNTKNIFAIGDCATQENLPPLPQTAQCAQQEGNYLCKAFNNIKKGGDVEHYEKFHFNKLGMMSYIGGYNAIVDISGNKLKGHTAWLFWRSAYLTKLLSIRNKILVPMYWFKTFVFGRDIATF